MEQIKAIEKLGILNKIIQGSNYVIKQINNEEKINTIKALKALYLNNVKLAELQKQIIDELVKNDTINNLNNNELGKNFANIFKGGKYDVK